MGPVCAASRACICASLLLTLGACSAAGAGPLARHPWIEDHSLALDAEHLTINVDRREVAVEARFEFRARGELTDRVMGFVIPPPCARTGDLVATLEAPGLAPVRLESRPGTEPALPMGAVAETHDVAVPGPALARYRTLVVRYRQRCADTFRYTLLTGAYWHGPIRELIIDVRDPYQRVQAASAEGRRPHDRSAVAFRWRLRDLEPSSGVLLQLKPN